MAVACPAAPTDPQIPSPDNFMGIKTSYKATLKRRIKRQEKQDKKEILISKTGRVLMLTRDTHERARVKADEFTRNRRAAMKKTQSSRYAMRYNFGGYIPATHDKHRRRPRVVFNTNDYAEYLKEHICDFLDNIIFLDKKTEEDIDDIDDNESTLSAEEKRKAKEEAEIKRNERLAKLFAYKKNFWNTDILDYLEEINQDVTAKTGQDDYETKQNLDDSDSRLDLSSDLRKDNTIQFNKSNSVSNNNGSYNASNSVGSKLDLNSSVETNSKVQKTCCIFVLVIHQA